ncbi:alpha/beta hydrolase-fold protein [Pseudoalteromonas sp. NC201]|uniref:alpha/beta hydrolase-fold protein n=2 Tax=Pseudoalteromonas TaxID=53246 RepID=UPI000CA3107C|nr:alpha/beta hydrolase-fold protein [Pseudoalteromonas sp. NC201]AUJ70485.1 Putative esterase [Pseudoalteromonas sp. NC201]
MTAPKGLKTLVLYAFLFFPACGSTAVTVTQQDPVVIGNTLVLKSEILNNEIPLNIALPSNFDLSSKLHTYPVIFLVGKHGSEFFHAVSGIVKHLADVERMPETIVVSINGGSPSPDIYHNDMFGGQSNKKWPSWGEPKKYHDFYQNELFPFLKAHYRANEKRTVIAISTSSFFPLNNLIHEKQLFDTYVFLAAADIIGMGYTPNKTMVDSLVERVSEDPKNGPLIYFAVAGDDLKKEKKYQSNVNKLKSRLKSIKDLPFILKIYDNEGHYDALLKTMLDVIEIKYPKPLWSAKYRDIVTKPGNALKNIDNYYDQLSERYGFTILPRSTRWNSVNRLGFISTYLIRQGRVIEAIEVAERYTEYQPKSWQAYESLAKAFEANEDNLQALKNTKVAVRLVDNEVNKSLLLEYINQLTEAPE